MRAVRHFFQNEGLWWLARLVAGPSAFVEALVSVASVAGGVILTALLIRLLVRFFHWRRRSRADVMTAQARVVGRQIAEAV